MSPRQINIQWKDVRKKVLDKEVLAIGYQEEMAIGYVYQKDGDYVCELEGETLTGVTHYIDLGELRALRRLQLSTSTIPPPPPPPPSRIIKEGHQPPTPPLAKPRNN